MARLLLQGTLDYTHFTNEDLLVASRDLQQGSNTIRSFSFWLGKDNQVAIKKEMAQRGLPNAGDHVATSSAPSPQ